VRALCGGGVLQHPKSSAKPEAATQTPPVALQPGQTQPMGRVCSRGANRHDDEMGLGDGRVPMVTGHGRPDLALLLGKVLLPGS
jgi:hypothetical protein